MHISLFMTFNNVSFIITIYIFFITAVMGNHVKSIQMNQASSDSELTKFRTRTLQDSQIDLTEAEKLKALDGLSQNAKGLFLPGVQNMKHNVSEKVAQVILYNCLKDKQQN